MTINRSTDVKTVTIETIPFANNLLNVIILYFAYYAKYGTQYSHIIKLSSSLRYCALKIKTC